MAKKKQVGRRVEGWKTKDWFKVHVPDNLGKAYIGDTIATIWSVIEQDHDCHARRDPERLRQAAHEDRVFKIATVTGDAAYTEFVGHEVTRDYLRSLVKRGIAHRLHCPGCYKGQQRRVRLTICCYTFARANISQEHAIRNAIVQAVAVQGTGLGLKHAPFRDRLW